MDMKRADARKSGFAVAEKTGHSGTSAGTTRDEPDYDKLMRGRLALLASTV